jgi:von Willebrand factor type A domain-containing protein
VAGRHRQPVASRPGRVIRTTLLSLGVVLALVLAAGGWVLAGSRRAASCEGSLALTIHAAPGIASVLQTAADRLRGAKAAVDGVCVDATVVEREPARVAAYVAGAASGEASPDDLPDIWVPDSSLWLDMVRSDERTRSEVPPASVSIAASPVVVAMTRPVAARLAAAGAATRTEAAPGEPDAPSSGIGWGRLLDALSARQPLAFGMPDPVSSATGVATLYGLYEVLTQRKAPPTAVTATCRVLGANAAPTVSELTSRVPAMPSDKGLQAFAADEAAIWRFNREQPGVPLVAVYPAEGSMRLDYPYAVLPRAAADPDKSEASATLLAEIVAPSGDDAIFAAGLRLPDGTPGPQASAVSGVSWVASPALERPARDVTRKLLKQWTLANLNMRTLVLFDVSGSMGKEVPGTGATRMELTAQAAQQGLGLFEDDNMLGAWAFSTELTRTTDYREVIPVGLLSERFGKGTRRSEIAAALEQLKPKPLGRTGLYDTIRAAHRHIRATYDATRVNSVIVLTDGQNEDPGSVTLPALLAELRAVADPRRPVPVISIAFGPEIDIGPLRQIAGVTGGGAYAVRDPRQITEVFLDAISKRTCRPNC